MVAIPQAFLGFNLADPASKGRLVASGLIVVGIFCTFSGEGCREQRW